MDPESNPTSEVSGSPDEDTAESPHRQGLHITINSVNIVLKQLLPSEGACRNLEEIKMGYNNKSYSVTTAAGNDYIIRITKTTWAKEKVECEMVLF